MDEREPQLDAESSEYEPQHRVLPIDGDQDDESLRDAGLIRVHVVRIVVYTDLLGRVLRIRRATDDDEDD